MRNVLVPTDFSKNSWNAIEYALHFFKDELCNFYLLHVTALQNLARREPIMVPSVDTIEITLEEEAKTKLAGLIKKIKVNPLSKQHNFFSLVTDDYFIDSVRKQISEKNIDLIVMGTKGANGLRQAIIGSNTGDLITKVKCPVLVVPEEAVFTRLNEIAFPTDFNIFYQTRILTAIGELSKKFDAAIRILQVAKKDEKITAFQQENKDFLNDFFVDKKHSFHVLTNRKVHAGVQCFVESRDIDLIIMIAKNLNLFQQILFKPTVEEISYHTKVPFLVLHEMS